MRRPHAPLTVEDVATQTGIPVPRIRRWVRDGMLRPSVEMADGQGRGHRHLFSARDLATLRVARRLSEKGVWTGALDAVIDLLQRTAGWDAPWSRKYLVWDEDDRVRVMGGERLLLHLDATGNRCGAMSLREAPRALERAADLIREMAEDEQR